jgi:hypothetical protein
VIETQIQRRITAPARLNYAAAGRAGRRRRRWPPRGGKAGTIAPVLAVAAHRLYRQDVSGDGTSTAAIAASLGSGPCKLSIET